MALRLGRARRGRMLLVVVAVALAVVGLTSCRKPAPQITVYGDGTTLQVSAAFYQQSGGPRRIYLDDFGQSPILSVNAGSRLHVDVPNQVSGSWVVLAVTVGSDGKSTPVKGVAPAEVLRNRYSVTLSTVSAGISDFYVQVAQLRGSAQAGGWVFHVKTTS